MVYQNIACVAWGHGWPRRLNVFFITRVIDMQTAFFTSLISKLFEIIITIGCSRVVLKLDCATYWRNYRFLGTIAAVCVAKFMIEIVVDYVCMEHGKSDSDG